MTVSKNFKHLILTAGLAFSLTACDTITGKETAGEYLDDSTITTKVKAKILADQHLAPFQISVETLQNTVQLSGFVTSHAEAQRAEHIAKQVKGVHHVKNDLVVRKAS